MKTPTNCPATRVLPGSLRRLLTRALVIVGLTVGTLATTATPADAASYVRGCFRYYTGTSNLGGTPVYLEAWTNYGWLIIATANLGPTVTSCVHWNIAPDTQPYYLRMRVFYRQSSTAPLFYSVSTKPAAPPGNAPYDFGTMLVYMQR